ncbi:MAG: TonB-dependent receptor plug domain-containing protein, partial [Bacteroidales bacterium]|nr:TonB-dependent receptor plug domain-containing protein [Bacteroidales bacterium]
SIISSTDPLILVDGAEMYDISSLNPNDVATITVLKDASTTIYGTRGANGVIIIKTKVGGQ